VLPAATDLADVVKCRRRMKMKRNWTRRRKTEDRVQTNVVLSND
jgi:hypothetical protein